jgi:hypothetical protein
LRDGAPVCPIAVAAPNAWWNMRLAWLAPLVFALDSTQNLTLLNVDAAAVTYHGRRAVRLTEHDTGGLALINGLDFTSGTIVVSVAGNVEPNPVDTSSRGFVGIAFRTSADGGRYETFYLRMTNGRAEDQLRRNHSAQYMAMPDAPWYKLREETPGRYESYVDLKAGEWTTMRIVVDGRHAKLFVNDATQPCLVVNDLRLDDSHGRIALWVGPSTVGYFSHLVVSDKRT